jgi:hypothetical protein
LSRPQPPTLQEYFAAVRTFIAKLEADGHEQAARELREGYGCLNGLTDGWAQFLESIDRVRKTCSAGFDKDDRESLKMIRAVAYRAVYRR